MALHKPGSVARAAFGEAVGPWLMASEQEEEAALKPLFTPRRQSDKTRHEQAQHTENNLHMWQFARRRSVVGLWEEVPQEGRLTGTS